MTSGALLERDGDRRRIRDVLDAARDGAGGVVVVSAAAGMGKTKLLESAIEDAREAGTRVLVARASELERDFAFGVVRELFEAAVVAADEVSRATLLSGAARQAAAVFDLDPDAPLDREVHATLHGL